MLGEFALPHSGAVWTSTIIEGLALLDVSERNARQAVARLSDQGIVTSERVGRHTRWHLTDTGRRLLVRGTARIYGFGDTEEAWDAHWLVVVASVPEEQRVKRHQLRSQLEFAGFGFISAGIAVSPHTEREPTANAILHELGLQDSAVVWLAQTGSFVPDQEIIRRAWDVDALARRYGVFLGEFEAREPRRAEDRFTSLVELVHGWRRFPFSDPEIPIELLPPNWPGRSAKLLFDARRSRWGPSAHEWFLQAEAHGGSPQVASPAKPEYFT